MSSPSEVKSSVGTSSIDDLIDIACDEYEEALRAGRRPNLHEFLQRIDQLQRSRLFRELLYVEFEIQPPPASENPRDYYLKEYPAFANEIFGMKFVDDVDEVKDTVPYCPGDRGPVERPRTFSRFRLEKTLGMGGMGEVWKAYDPHLDRYVALKFPRAALPSEEDLRRFLREGRAAAQLQHPNIVPVHEVAHEGGTAYIVSDYIEGGDLRSFLDSSRLSYHDAAQLCSTIAGALHYAHNRGIVHRDLKPANVLMDADKCPHVTDFGLAKWTRDADAVTATGEVLGTPAYMSPEQARGRAADVDRRCDVYALGVMLYEMITGRLPFSGDLATMLRSIADEPPKAPRAVRRDIPRDLATICMKAMEKDPARRYSTALELADDLQRFHAGEPIHARPIGLVERGWRWCKRRPAATISLLLLVALMAAGWYAYLERAESRRAADIREVRIDTEPSGAEVVFVPLNDLTSLPEPSRLVQAGLSPVEVSLAPGDYLVVAAHTNGKFHEAYRHVPRSDEGLAGAFDTIFYIMDRDGTIRLMTVKLWANSEIGGMQRVEISSSRDGRREVLLVDEREMNAADLGPRIAGTRHQSSPPSPFLCEYTFALYCAESVGKRLPTAPEFERILDAVDPQTGRPLAGLLTEPWEWTSTSAAATSMPVPVPGYAGSVELVGTALLYGGSRLKQGRPLEKYGGGEPAAIRGVRSLRPRLRAEDFLLLDLSTRATIDPATME